MEHNYVTVTQCIVRHLVTNTDVVIHDNRIMHRVN